ncbi:MAG: hypothetical protein ACOH13_00870 [Flavobacteriales bacterium]
MPEFHYASLYIAGAVWILQRAFAPGTGTQRIIRTSVVAVLFGAASLFIPMHSGMMAVLLCAAFLVGVMGLTVLFSRRTAGGQRTFSGTLLVQLSLMFLAMLVMAAPLALMAWASAR